MINSDVPRQVRKSRSWTDVKRVWMELNATTMGKDGDEGLGGELNRVVG